LRVFTCVSLLCFEMTKDNCVDVRICNNTEVVRCVDVGVDAEVSVDLQGELSAEEGQVTTVICLLLLPACLGHIVLSLKCYWLFGK